MSKEKKQTQKARGNFLLELLAVILAVALIFTLTYPAQLWKQEEQNQQECRENLQHIYYAEVTYLDSTLAYNDTLQKVIDFILSDTTEKLLRRYTSLDSVLGSNIIDMFEAEDTLVTITVDSVFGEGPDSVLTFTQNIQVNALVDSMLSFANSIDLDTTEAFVIDSLRHWPLFSERIDSIALATLTAIHTCPTVNRDYIISVNNDTVPKMIDIYCPIDSTDQEALKEDFQKSFLGGLKIENHGGLESGEKTW